MDLQEEIFKTLEGKEYDDFTKIRWIYLYICEIFSYDTRYIFANKKMKEDIYNKKMNITNIEDFEIVCYTISRILVDALAAFGYKAEIKRDTNKELSHVYVVVEHNGYILKLDPTKRHDVTRVKMNSTTIDFESLSNDDFFSDQLLESDKKIASDFDGLYFSKKSVMNVVEKTLKEINMYAIEHNLSKGEIFFKKLEALFGMINSRTDLKRYDDIDFYYSYLLKIFKINKKEVLENGNVTYIDHYYVKPVVLFNINDDSMKDIINISHIQYDNLQPIFYLLRKESEAFKIREIFRDEALDLLNKYENPLCQHLIVETAKKLPTGKQNGFLF